MLRIKKFSLISILLIISVLLSLLSSFPAFAEEEQASEEIPVLVLEDQFGMFEAEDMLVQGAYNFYEDERASGGKTIGTNLVINTTYPDEIRAMNNGNDHARMYIEVKEEAYYTLWVRSHYINNSYNGNYWVNFNGETIMRHYDNCSDYYWNSVWATVLKPGRYYLGFIPRRFNVRMDKILITSSEYYAPSGEGGKPAPFVLGPEGETKTNLYFPLPSYYPPNEHPRLYLRNKDIPKIKENLTHPENIKAWTEVQRVANQNKNCKVKDNATQNFDTSVHEYLESCAFMYALDNKKNLSYGKKAVAGLNDYLGSLSYSGENMSLARSGVIQYIAKVYDWCYNLLTDKDKEFFIKKSLSIATKLEVGFPPVKLSAFNSDHGGEGGIQVDMMSIGIATYEDYPDIWNMAAGRYFSEYIPNNNFWYNQTWWQAEGDSYGHSRYTYEAKGNSIIDKLGFGGLVSPNEQYLSYNMIYRRRPDGNFLQDGDIWDITFQNSSPSCYKGSGGSLLSASYRYKDPYLKYELYKMFENGYQDSGSDGAYSLVDFLILNDTSIGLKSNEELPLTGYTGEGHNMMTARTGWEDGLESNTMIVSMKGGGRTRGGHMHCDAGNFVIYYKGPLAMDTGVYNGQPFVDDDGKAVTNVQAGSYHFANYQQRTIAHNCILLYDPNEDMKYHTFGELNDGGQLKITGRVPNTGVLTYESMSDDTKILATRLGVDYGPDMNKPSYSYLKTDITNAYSVKMKEYQRTFMFQNFFDDTYPGALIVMDKVVSSNPDFKKTWLLHSQEEPVVDGQTTTIKRTEYGYNGVLVNEALLPKADDSVTEKIGGPGKEYWVDGRNVKAVTVTKGDESGKWRIEISPKTPKETDYYLNVMHVYANDGNITPLKSELYEVEDNYVGVKIKDRVTYLTKQATKISKEIYVYAEGEEDKLYWTIDGLNTGRWEVTDQNGKRVTYGDVTKEGGVLYFEAAPGAYSVKKLRGYAKIPSKNFDILAAVSEKEIPIEIKYAYNTMYQYVDPKKPIIEMNDDVYMPAETVFDDMDRYLTLKEEGDKLSLFFEDKNYEFKLDSKKVKLVEENKTKEMKSPIKKIDGIIYFPISTIKDILNKNISYDAIGKVVRVTDKFTRPEDFILEVTAPDRIQVVNAAETMPASNTKAYMALDGDTSTSASLNAAEGGSLTYEFDDVQLLNKVSINWNDPTNRDYYYEFLISEDGENFTLLQKGQTGFTLTETDYEFEPVKAKYFKIISHGNTVNNWFVIKEIRFFKEVK